MYRSFLSGMKALPDKDRLAMIDAIAAYCLDGIEPEFTGLQEIMWGLMRPQFDANIRKREYGKRGAEHGKKGGRPPKNNPKETPEKPLNNPTETPNENVNENVNDNGHSHLGKKRQPITLDHNTGVPRNEQLGLIGYYMHNAGEETLEFFRRIDNAMPTAVLCHHQAAELFDKCKRRKLTTQELKEMFRNQAITGKWEWLSDEETARVRPDMSQRIGAYIPGETHV